MTQDTSKLFAMIEYQTADEISNGKDIYKILKLIGTGGMSRVYQASNGAKNVAIKQLFVYCTSPDELKNFVAQFETESKIMQNLNHIGIPKFYEFFFDKNNCVFIAMELLEGETLQDIFDKLTTPMPQDEVIGIMLEVAKTIEYLHSKKVILRDLKPLNIMILKNGKVKIIDFGISKIQTAPNSYTKTIIQNLGSSGFAAPEQYLIGHHTDQRSDIYSFGATMFYLLTKADPAKMQQIMFNKESFSTAKFGVNINSELEYLILQLTDFDADSRAQKMKDVISELEKIYQKLTVKPQPVQAANLDTDLLYKELIEGYLAGKSFHKAWETAHKIPADPHSEKCFFFLCHTFNKQLDCCSSDTTPSANFFQRIEELADYLDGNQFPFTNIQYRINETSRILAKIVSKLLNEY